MTDPKPLRVGERVKIPAIIESVYFGRSGDLVARLHVGDTLVRLPMHDLERLPDDAATRGGGEGSE